MSVKAMTWAWTQKVGTQAERLVLLALADSADNVTNQCWPSHKHLAQDAMCSVATVKRALKSLEAGGFVRKKHRFSDNTQQSNLYELVLDPPVHCEPPVHSYDLPPRSPDELPPRSPDELQNHQLTINESSSIAPACRFEDFWKAYPIHKGKKKSREYWNRRKAFFNRIADQLLDDIQKRKAKDRQWIEGYIPWPQKYLNQELWTDDMQPPKPKPKANLSDAELLALAQEKGISTIGKTAYQLRQEVLAA